MTHPHLAYLTRKREGALNLFRKVVNKLNHVQSQIIEAQKENYAAIADAEARLVECRDAEVFLANEAKATAESIERIEGLMRPSSSQP